MLHSKCCCFPLPTQFFHYAPGSCNSNGEKHKGGAGKCCSHQQGHGDNLLDKASKVCSLQERGCCFLLALIIVFYFLPPTPLCLLAPALCRGAQSLPPGPPHRQGMERKQFWKHVLEPTDKANNAATPNFLPHSSPSSRTCSDIFPVIWEKIK